MPSLQKLNSLVFLGIGYNALGTKGPNDLDFFCSLTNATKLQILDIKSNNHGGSLPECICNLSSNLTALWLQGNHIQGIIPDGIASFVSKFVAYFSIAWNNIHGRIPQSFCNATELISLELWGNQLHGSIPNCLIASSQSLVVLDLKENHIDGTIPDHFGIGCKLETLILSDNFLQGQLPRSLANCSELKLLDLKNNNLNGTFPCELDRLYELQVLVLRSNQFRGTLNCPWNELIWPSLQILDLASNHFTGKITTQFISKWKSMILGAKELQSKQGTLFYPSNARNVYYTYSDAVTLTFKGNEFELVKILKIFVSIDLSNNAFHGEIPTQLGNLNALIVLNLSHNSLSGNIPTSFGNLRQLESLDLSHNDLTGSIPQEMVSLNFLEWLNLSYNKLEGPIPTSTQLQSFNASSYEGNPGLYGPPLTPRHGSRSLPASPPSSFKSEVTEWMLTGAAVGFPVGLTVFIGPLLYVKRWRRWYCKHLGRVALKLMGREDQSKRRRRRNNRRLQQQRH